MTSLGSVDIGDVIRLEAVITNISDMRQNASSIKFGIVNYDGDILHNYSSYNISNTSTGTYIYDLYLDSSVYSTGVHYVAWAGYTYCDGSNISFVEDNDYFFIEKAKI